MKKLLFVLLMFVSIFNYAQTEKPLDSLQNLTQREMLACPPSLITLSCNTPVNLNLNASGYVGSNPTSGQSGCNPCCYSGADLDCDGVQDVPFSVENSVWYQYCNTTGSSMVITVTADEPGSGSSCNLQGAIWVGSSFNTTSIGCNNSQYSYYDSNPGGAADGWSFTATVPNGQCAYFMVDGYGGSTCSGISVSVTCPTPLPIELLYFKGEKEDAKNKLTWATASETNCDHFEIFRSQDGVYFESIGIIPAAGNSTQTRTYMYFDTNPLPGVGYYILREVDFNGQFENSQIIAIDNSKTEVEVIRTVNLMGQDIDSNYEGLRIIYYSNGKVEKRVGK
jgi:hypothetical protein